MSQDVTVLVAEDDALIRMSVVTVLEEEGFRVLEAANADEAIRHLNSEPRIDLLFTDVDMPPGMSGIELARTVDHQWPPVRLIVTSGVMRPTHSQLPPQALFFSKPYDFDHLARTIRAQVMDNR